MSEKLWKTLYYTPVVQQYINTANLIWTRYSHQNMRQNLHIAIEIWHNTIQTPLAWRRWFRISEAD